MFAIFGFQWVKSIFCLHILIAKCELSGHFVKKNLVSQERGNWIVPVPLIKQMSSDLYIWRRKRQTKDEKKLLQ